MINCFSSDDYILIKGINTLESYTIAALNGNHFTCMYANIYWLKERYRLYIRKRLFACYIPIYGYLHKKLFWMFWA